MRALLLCLLVGCVPSRASTFGPVDREVQRRTGVAAAWSGTADPRVPDAVQRMLAAPLDRDAVVKIALATNRHLQAEYDRLGIAADDVASATVLRPLEVDVEWQPAHGESEIDVVQDVLELIQLPARRGAAIADLDAARARAVAATVELVARVEGAYVDMVAAQQELELRQTAFDAAAASAELAERMRAAGNIPELALLRERDQREQTRIDLTRARVEVETARAALDEVLGLGDRVAWTVAGRLPELPDAAPNLATLERDAVANNLELDALRNDAEAARSRRTVARARSVLPTLGIGIAIDRPDDGDWHVGPALRLGLPLFDQGQGPRARANAELRRSRNAALATAVDIRARSRAIRERVLGTYAEARQLRDVVLPLRQAIVSETLKQYNAMNISTFELVTSRRDLIDGGRQYIDALRRFWRAAADARALARGGMPHGGAEPPRVAPARSSSTEAH